MRKGEKGREERRDKENINTSKPVPRSNVTEKLVVVSETFIVIIGDLEYYIKEERDERELAARKKV